jgi:hypothetical protein
VVCSYEKCNQHSFYSEEFSFIRRVLVSDLPVVADSDNSSYRHTVSCVSKQYYIAVTN